MIIKRFSKTSEEDEKLGLDEVEIEEKYAYNYHKDQPCTNWNKVFTNRKLKKKNMNQIIITENVNSSYESGLKSRHHDEQSPLIEYKFCCATRCKTMGQEQAREVKDDKPLVKR